MFFQILLGLFKVPEVRAGFIFLMLVLYTFNLIAIKQAEPFPMILSQCITVVRYNHEEGPEKGKRKG